MIIRKYQITVISIVDTLNYFLFSMIKYLDNHLSDSVVQKLSSFVKNEKNIGQLSEKSL